MPHAPCTSCWGGRAARGEGGAVAGTGSAKDDTGRALQLLVLCGLAGGLRRLGRLDVVVGGHGVLAFRDPERRCAPRGAQGHAVAPAPRGAALGGGHAGVVFLGHELGGDHGGGVHAHVRAVPQERGLSPDYPGRARPEGGPHRRRRTGRVPHNVRGRLALALLRALLLRRRVSVVLGNDARSVAVALNVGEPQGLHLDLAPPERIVLRACRPGDLAPLGRLIGLLIDELVPLVEPLERVGILPKHVLLSVLQLLELVDVAQELPPPALHVVIVRVLRDGE
mmetsp:Transcript_8115/g.27621  ORF Transcript_8115/g.27621 Transcript_8115/m.27621 type:complete len:281 (+) Transcript_8115:96-938(+)